MSYCSLIVRELFFSDIDPNFLNDVPVANDFINKFDNLSTLNQVLNITNWRNNIQNSQEYTFLAPTNEAFNLLLADNDNWINIEDVPVKTLSNILDYHFIPNQIQSFSDTIVDYIGSNLASEFENAPTSLLIKTEGSIRINGERNVALQDVRVKEGILHLVNEIVAIPNLETLINAHPQLTTFSELLNQNRFSTDFIKIINENTSTTVFAPTDTAFIVLMSDLGINALSELPTEELENYLLNHISKDGNLRWETFSSIASFTTLANGNKMNFGSFPNASISINNGERPAKFVNFNGQATNGIVHVIDRVLSP